MKILQINAVYKNGGSTGRIVYDLKKTIEETGNSAYVAFGYEYKKTCDANTYKIESIPELKFSILMTRLFARHGFYNVSSTRRLLKWIDVVKPDVIHLHNLHCHYMNVEILFDYIKKKKIPVVWTLHDCWSFTGWCAHFDYVGCEKWKNECMDCPNKHEYPFTWFFDRSNDNYKKKRACFCGIENLTIVTPSRWLAEKAKLSFLGEYSIKVINNGIDLTKFYPRQSLIREKYGLESKRIILAVAMGMSKLKGFSYITEMANQINHSNEVIIVVGLEKSQISKLPLGIVGFERTSNVDELAEFYSVADVFINPTLQDTFPTTNLEALACGTPVVTFDAGGSAESVIDGCGIVVKKDDGHALIEAVYRVLNEYNEDNREKCISVARRFYDKNICFSKYIELYKETVSK